MVPVIRPRYIYLSRLVILNWWLTTLKQVEAHSPAPLLAENNCDAAFFSEPLVRKWGYYVCVCMITRGRKAVKRAFLPHSHSTPPHPHCYSLPPHPQFPSCAFFRVYWRFFLSFSHIRQQSQPFYPITYAVLWFSFTQAWSNVMH